MIGARRDGHPRSGGRSRGLHWRPQKSLDYFGLIRLPAFRSSALTSRPTALARAAIVSSVMFRRPASTKETYCCVRSVRAAN
jgi:hypothetical protein